MSFIAVDARFSFFDILFKRFLWLYPLFVIVAEVISRKTYQRSENWKMVIWSTFTFLPVILIYGVVF